MVVDGPYAEAKEVLASLAIVDCASHDRAMELAARITAAVGDIVKVRPIMERAPTAGQTDWRQILGLYDLLVPMTGNPVVRLNRAVAVAMVRGPRAGLAALEDLACEPALHRHHRLPAVRAHLWEMLGELERAREDYLAAARLTTSLPEQHYLRRKARACDATATNSG